MGVLCRLGLRQGEDHSEWVCVGCGADPRVSLGGDEGFSVCVCARVRCMCVCVLGGGPPRARDCGGRFRVSGTPEWRVRPVFVAEARESLAGGCPAGIWEGECVRGSARQPGPGAAGQGHAAVAGAAAGSAPACGAA